MERIRKEDISKIKIYLGPMSKNIVDAIIDYNTKYDNSVGIVASRRQIDYMGGYVNNWTTEEFVRYVKGKNPNVVVCRDHGGIGQGTIDDDGKESFKVDVENMDIIHIDPFKKLPIESALVYTANIIRDSVEVNENCLFEVGTEQSIFPMTPTLFEYFLMRLQLGIPDLFSKITYGVIQSGTSLLNGVNTGEYNVSRLQTMIDTCKNYGILSKEHNGDYLQGGEIKKKFKIGLSSINIAPEIAHIETEFILNEISEDKINKWFKLCIENGQWEKWFPTNYNPTSDPKRVLRLCGHYVFTNPQFIDIFDLRLASEYVTERIEDFINERI